MDNVWSVYMIRCGDRSLYTGISNNVEQRFAVHQSGSPKSAKYLRSRHPLQLVYQAEIGSRSEASRVELLIKRLPKQTKEALVMGTILLADIVCLTKVEVTDTTQA
ncbi:MAG: GIY-YIG nuclease family protein [Leptolyngbyaceae bacterium]|nr:GIY-YIG nuclease family protein [Leptolyngbyaceae bacterium]